LPLELSQLHYDIRHTPGVCNVEPDALSRSYLVPLHLVCVFVNCTHHSAILVSLDFATSYHNVICLTPARRRKPSVDRAELALKLNRLFKLW